VWVAADGVSQLTELEMQIKLHNIFILFHSCFCYYLLQESKALNLGHERSTHCDVVPKLGRERSTHCDVVPKLGRERSTHCDVLSFESGSSRSHCVEKPFWKRLWTCRESDRILNEWGVKIGRQKLEEKACSWFVLISVFNLFSRS
jgi:hypothetical protein